MLHLGATDWVPISLELGDADAASCDTHVAIRVRAQSDLIRLRLFKDLGDSVSANPAFTTVFDGQLLLDNGRLAVGDVEGLTRFVYQLGDRGTWNVRVAVDKPGWDACAIDVTVGRPSTA
ncbi:hypothetical protein [Streptomyces sp. NPDC046197]|uniref:hypothetical protein n=1 Tax=Streptomyces sp. NPDC046197 TaxID=3154337 RepID=UPI0033CBE84D